MFTGIIEAIGEIAELRPQEGDLRLRIRSRQLDLGDVKLGDSIAVNGVCLTVTELPGDGFWADVSRETLAHTRFDKLQPGERVNLEKALMPTSRLGGHIVSGHVDGIGEVVDRHEDGRAIRFSIRPPAALMRYIAPKGSICIDGVSLTVNQVESDRFGLTIVPHTLEETLIKYYSVGRRVNLEVDIIARYLERLLGATQVDEAEAPATAQTETEGLTLAFLANHGFHGRR